MLCMTGTFLFNVALTRNRPFRHAEHDLQLQFGPSFFRVHAAGVISNRDNSFWISIARVAVGMTTVTRYSASCRGL